MANAGGNSALTPDLAGPERLRLAYVVPQA
jgi:hypothetical protein